MHIDKSAWLYSLICCCSERARIRCLVILIHAQGCMQGAPCMQHAGWWVSEWEGSDRGDGWSAQHGQASGSGGGAHHRVACCDPTFVGLQASSFDLEGAIVRFLIRFVLVTRCLGGLGPSVGGRSIDAGCLVLVAGAGVGICADDCRVIWICLGACIYLLVSTEGARPALLHHANEEARASCLIGSCVWGGKGKCNSCAHNSTRYLFSFNKIIRLGVLFDQKKIALALHAPAWQVTDDQKFLNYPNLNQSILKQIMIS